ncbi:glycosyltransferase, partial [Streptococcus pneumoniae]
NAGVSNARNIGIQHSRGEWITFIDSDDFITPDYLETLISVIDSDDSIGFSIARLHHIKNGQITELPVFSGKAEKWSTEQTMRELLMTTQTSFFPVAKLFKREVISGFIFNT